MKSLNGDLQMRSDWLLPICNGNERLRENGKKVHSTQKPEALLYRVILSSTDPGDLVLDPFFGTGTTGAVAKVLHRRWIGIEREARYVEVARKRIEAVQAEPYDPQVFDVRDRRRRERRIPFATLLERGLLRPGQELYFQRDRKRAARVKPDGRLYVQGFEGSIHQAAKHLAQGRPCNGWEHWYYLDEEGALRPLDALRRMVRADLQKRQPAVVRAG
jgi:modification methylase